MQYGSNEGVVNQITKSGSNNFESSANYSYANYLSSKNDIFEGIDNLVSIKIMILEFNLVDQF